MGYWLNILRTAKATFNLLSAIGSKKHIMLEVVRQLYRDIHERTRLPGEDDSLSYIIDIGISAPVEQYIEKRNAKPGENKKWIMRSGETVPFCVTLRSNHVTPGWKFNSDTVRWYIDDINFSSRMIPIMEKPRKRCPGCGEIH